MHYKCLVLDHDDTVVASTASIHYPSFVEYMKLARPGVHYSFEEYYRQNFAPGVIPFFRDVVGLSEQEMHEEFEFWQNYLKTRVPRAYDSIREILLEHRKNGGIIAVVSHSVASVIERDYRENDLPMPDVIFGWDYPPEQRKPNPWPLEQIMAQFSLQPSELLMVDDLKPGYDMAAACGVDFCAVGWATDIAEIEQFMRQYGKYYCKQVADLAALLSK